MTEYLTTSEVAERLGISKRAVNKKIANGEIYAEMIGGRNAIPLANVESGNLSGTTWEPDGNLLAKTRALLARPVVVNPDEVEPQMVDLLTVWEMVQRQSREIAELRREVAELRREPRGNQVGTDREPRGNATIYDLFKDKADRLGLKNRQLAKACGLSYRTAQRVRLGERVCEKNLEIAARWVIGE